MDVVAHLEYFYNTLFMNHNTQNPFANPNLYPALLYEDNTSPGTLLEKHRQIIFPATSCSSKDSKLLQSLSISPPTKYTWYPNPSLESPLHSPMKTSYCMAPEPKQIRNIASGDGNSILDMRKHSLI